MGEVTANLTADLLVDCPSCHQSVNLFEVESCNFYILRVFSGRWDNLEGVEEMCLFCGKEFKIKKVIW